MTSDESGAVDLEHFGRIAHLSTPPRRAVLRALLTGGPMTPDQIADSWLRDDASLTASAVQRVPAMVRQSLWKLANLGLVRVEDGQVIITALGVEVTGLDDSRRGHERRRRRGRASTRSRAAGSR